MICACSLCPLQGDAPSKSDPELLGVQQSIASRLLIAERQMYASFDRTAHYSAEDAANDVKADTSDAAATASQHQLHSISQETAAPNVITVCGPFEAKGIEGYDRRRYLMEVTNP